MMLRLELLVQHLPEERFGLLQLVLLVLHVDSGRSVVLEDLPPRVQQVHYPVLNAPQTFFALCFIRERLLANALEEGREESLLQLCADLCDPFDTGRRRQARFEVARQPHHRPGKAAIERSPRTA